MLGYESISQCEFNYYETLTLGEHLGDDALKQPIRMSIRY